MRSNGPLAQEKAVGAKKAGASGGIVEAYRFNTLGVAYMNQQRPADAKNISIRRLRPSRSLRWRG